MYVWDEKQNVTLTSNLKVDRVADPSASYVQAVAGGYEILAGTVVSSHYVQWDPLNAVVKARLEFDSEIFAFITADQKLFDSDDVLGHPDVDYNDFGARGLELGDLTNWGPTDLYVDVDWYATNPGDWTRLITAYSPGGVIPAPGAVLLGGIGVGIVGWLRKQRTL